MNEQKKDNRQLSNVVAKALQQFHESEKTMRDRMALREALFSVIAELRYINYQDDLFKVFTKDKEELIEDVKQVIPLVGNIDEKKNAIDRIGYTILCDSYIPE